jgi:tetratricopeptide (TPR) repeat protein
VQLLPLTADLAASFQSKSTPEEWARRGKQFFNEHVYDSALLCFERAGDAFNAKWARAAGQRQEAERDSNRKSATDSYLRASETFLEIGKGEAAADCLQRAQTFVEAGVVLREQCKPPLWGKAAECFEQAGSWEDAAEAYSKAGERKLALASCLKGRQLQLGIGLLKEWEESGEAEDVVNIKGDYLYR